MCVCAQNGFSLERYLAVGSLNNQKMEKLKVESEKIQWDEWDCAVSANCGKTGVFSKVERIFDIFSFTAHDQCKKWKVFVINVQMSRMLGKKERERENHVLCLW